MYFSPQTLKPGYGPGSAKTVSAITIFFWRPFGLEMQHNVENYFL